MYLDGINQVGIFRDQGKAKVAYGCIRPPRNSSCHYINVLIPGMDVLQERNEAKPNQRFSGYHVVVPESRYGPEFSILQDLPQLQCSIDRNFQIIENSLRNPSVSGRWITVPSRSDRVARPCACTPSGGSGVSPMSRRWPAGSTGWYGKTGWTRPGRRCQGNRRTRRREEVDI